MGRWTIDKCQGDMDCCSPWGPCNTRHICRRPLSLTWIDCDLPAGSRSGCEDLNAFASHLLEAGALPAQPQSCLGCRLKSGPQEPTPFVKSTPR